MLEELERGAIGDDIGMSQHDTFRRARCTRRVTDGSQIFWRTRLEQKLT